MFKCGSRSHLASVVVVALCGLLAGCHSKAKEDRLVIGLAVPSLTHPFFIYLKDNVMDEARQLGVDVIAADAEDVAARQMAVIEDFIARDVAGVLMSPIGADALVPAVESLNQAGIPVATVDRQVSGGEVLVHVGADNVEGGRLAARYILERLGGKGNIIQLEGTPGASPAIDRKTGFEEEIGKSTANIVASQPADFQRAKGQTVMENLLQVHEEFQAVYAANDEMMLGAIEAMEARKVDATRVVSVGYDAIPDAIRYVREGRLDATVEQYPGKQARTAMRLLVAFIRDKQRPTSNQIFVKPVVIDAQNIDQAEQKR